MVVRSQATDTGWFQLVGGAWKELDPWETVAGSPDPVMEAFELVGGTWKVNYLRDLEPFLTITSPPLSNVVSELDTHPAITGTAVDFRGLPLPGDLAVTRHNGDGTTTDLGTVAISQVDGSWSYSPVGTYSILGTTFYSFAYTGVSPYLSGTVQTNSFGVNSATVTITLTTQPSGDVVGGVSGTDITVAGTAIRQDANPALGTITFGMVNDDGNRSGVWETLQVQPDGSFTSGVHHSLALGQRQLWVNYEPLEGGIEDPTEVFGNTWTCILAPCGLVTPGNVTHDRVEMRVDGIELASKVQVYRGGSYINEANPGSNYTNTGGVSEYTTYAYKQRAKGTTPAGTTVYGAFGGERSARTGRLEKRDTGSKTNIAVGVVATNSYRRDVGWGYVGDKVRQGYYSSSYGGAGYFGLMDYGYQGIYNAVKNSIGTTRLNNCEVTGFRVGTYRESGVGAFNSSRTVTFTSSDSAAGSGGEPSGQWQATNKTMQPVGSFVWHELGARFGEEFITYKHRSICIRRHNSTDYLGINGKSSGASDCDVRIDVKWDYQTVAPASGVWL